MNSLLITKTKPYEQNDTYESLSVDINMLYARSGYKVHFLN